jgi:hypothetical protein
VQGFFKGKPSNAAKWSWNALFVCLGNKRISVISNVPKLHSVYNCPNGENSQNLVTLNRGVAGKSNRNAKGKISIVALFCFETLKMKFLKSWIVLRMRSKKKCQKKVFIKRFTPFQFRVHTNIKSMFLLNVNM